MSTSGTTRRQAIAAALAAGFAAMPLVRASAADKVATTAAMEITSGKIRGTREDGVAIFRGIPYGADTGAHRFQPAQAPKGWAGVRDCFTYGPWSVQSLRGAALPGNEPTSDIGKALAAIQSANVKPVFGEDCLVLDVFTPDASSRRKRPVMVWLHGGGFTSGAGGLVNYDGRHLAHNGDVVVVTLNHRINALGYLYLGALHDDFADSGNAGQLDIMLALQWVRDNIAAFGGDPGNVMIFGQSGGGSKASMLLASPAAKGLFHKAAIQSGPGITMTERADAAEVAELTLAALGVPKADVHKLQTMDIAAIIKAAGAVRLPAGRRGGLGPVIDGRALPAHPFFPAATEISRDIPVLVGSTAYEQILFMGSDPDFGRISSDDARKRFETQLGERSGSAFEYYRALRPSDQPSYWVAAMATDSATWINSIRLAERKSAQNAAPVFMYRLDWDMPVANGALRSPHGVDIPLIFGNIETGSWSTGMGTGPDKRKVSQAMQQAWVNFARSGNPASAALAWPRYDATARNTMIFNVNSAVVADPDRDKRAFWARMAT